MQVTVPGLKKKRSAGAQQLGHSSQSSQLLLQAVGNAHAQVQAAPQQPGSNSSGSLPIQERMRQLQSELEAYRRCGNGV
jgi:hypothetical protein